MIFVFMYQVPGLYSIMYDMYVAYCSLLKMRSFFCLKNQNTLLTTWYRKSTTSYYAFLILIYNTRYLLRHLTPYKYVVLRSIYNTSSTL